MLNQAGMFPNESRRFYAWRTQGGIFFDTCSTLSGCRSGLALSRSSIIEVISYHLTYYFRLRGGNLANHRTMHIFCVLSSNYFLVALCRIICFGQ